MRFCDDLDLGPASILFMPLPPEWDVRWRWCASVCSSVLFVPCVSLKNAAFYSSGFCGTLLHRIPISVWLSEVA